MAILHTNDVSLDKRKSLDECCLKIGYFTTLTVIYLPYLRWVTLEMDDNDDRQSSDGAETAQSQESGSQSNQLGSTQVSGRGKAMMRHEQWGLL